jgi:diguanylate cyclase (GGDEF)-like protein
MVDPLTGLANRRRFDQLMDSGDLPRPTTLLVIDVDKFKLVNVHYSHTAGDLVLRDIGTILKAHCRAAADIPVRYAGDEFTVFLHTDLPAAWRWPSGSGRRSRRGTSRTPCPACRSASVPVPPRSCPA